MLVGLNDIRTVQACISTNTKWNESIFGSESAKISCQIMVKNEGFWNFAFEGSYSKKIIFLLSGPTSRSAKSGKDRIQTSNWHYSMK